MAYKNPLDSFQSHSVHYVILACRTTEDVRSFTDGSPQAQTASLQAIDNTTQLGQEVKYGRSSGVYLLLDTRRFSQFTISNFQLETLVAGFAVPGSTTPNSTAVDMSFTVTDAYGIGFANFLQFMMDQRLQVSFDGMTLLVRVLFIGHQTDGTAKVVQSVSIPAIFNQIQVDLNDVRGVYECKCFPLVGMASNMGYNAKWSSIGRASSYFTGTGANTLGAVIKSFEERVNKELLARYASFNGETQAQGGKTARGKFGRLVQYMITIPKEWEEYTFTGPTQGGAIETEFKRLIEEADAQKAKTAEEAQKKAQQNTKAPAKDSFVAVPPSCTVTEVLDIIFSQTLKVRELANFTKSQDKDGNIKFYKHFITVTSDNQSFTVHVDVAEFVVPNTSLAETNSKATTSERDQALFKILQEPGRAPKKVPKNFIELDYIFSGKNIDVLSLDLKIENLNFLLMQNTKLGQGEIFTAANDGQDQSNGEGTGEDKRVVYGMRPMDPMLMPRRTLGESTNHKNIAANVQDTGGRTAQAVDQQYVQNISAFYNAGPITAKLELRGNPDIMVSVSPQLIPQHVSAVTIGDGGQASVTNDSVKQKYRESMERNLLRIAPNQPIPSGPDTMLSGPSYLTSPVFVKVNVYGPNVDFLSQPIAGGDFTRQLFYDNYYYLSKIVSKVDGTKFTQELELQSYSVFGFPSTNAKGAGTSTVKDVR